jgi:hypothetical protein
MKRKLTTKVSNGIKKRATTKTPDSDEPSFDPTSAGLGEDFDIDSFIQSQDVNLKSLGDSSLKPLSKKVQRRAVKAQKKTPAEKNQKKVEGNDEDEDGEGEGSALVLPVGADGDDEDAEELDQEEAAELKAYLEIKKEEMKAAKAKAKAEKLAKKAAKGENEADEDDEEDEEDDDDEEEEDESTQPAAKVYINDKVMIQ